MNPGTGVMEGFVQGWLFDPYVGKLVGALVGILVIVVLVGILKRYLLRYIKESENRYRARKFVTFIGYGAGIGLLAMVFSDKLGGLTVAFGVAGAGIAFALQEVIASVAGWLAVSAGNFYNTGDRIQLGGIMGDVIDIGILRTTIMECRQWVDGDQYNGRIVRVANSLVFKEPVFNYSGDFHFLWDEIVVPVKYGCDYRYTREMLLKIAREITAEDTAAAREAWKIMVDKYMIEDAKVEPAVFLIANDNWMEFSLRYVVGYTRRRLTKDLLYTRVLEEVDASGGRVAIASTTIHIVEFPKLEVKLDADNQQP